MIISLSEQLDSDIKAYIHKVFGVFVNEKVEQKGTKKLSEGSTCQRWSEQGCTELQQAPV